MLTDYQVKDIVIMGHVGILNLQSRGAIVDYEVGEMVTWREDERYEFATCLLKKIEKLNQYKKDYGLGSFKITGVRVPSGGLTLLMSPCFLTLEGCEHESFPLHYVTKVNNP